MAHYFWAYNHHVTNPNKIKILAANGKMFHGFYSVSRLHTTYGRAEQVHNWHSVTCSTKRWVGARVLAEVQFFLRIRNFLSLLCFFDIYNKVFHGWLYLVVDSTYNRTIDTWIFFRLYVPPYAALDEPPLYLYIHSDHIWIFEFCDVLHLHALVTLFWYFRKNN